MAMNAATIATNIANRLETDYGIVFTPEQQAEAEKIWNIVFDEFIKHFKTNAELKLLANDIHVSPGTFTAGATPVTGQGENQAVTLTGKME